MLKSDNEPATVALKEAVCSESDVELAMEEALVGDHQARGAVESAAENAQGLFRIVKDAVESKRQR